ncbi:MAG TPA: serine--tRNA ligase, partial [Aestuariivirgaceae bacterium]|nr:serine--tRNA ligase [Aestuariivirgaceae bacterium]
MHDIRWIRDNPEAFDRGLESRGLEPQAKGLVALDEKRRGLIAELQGLQERRNAASKEIGEAKKAKDEARAEALMGEVAGIKERMPEAEAAAKEIDRELDEALAAIPNVPAGDVPVGPDETANVEVRKLGSPRTFDFEPRQHFEIGEALGLMDFETAAKLSGSRFVVLKGALARMERALANFMLNLHTGEHGYTEIDPPLLVRDEAMFGTSQLPKFREDQFKTNRSATVDDVREIITRESNEFIKRNPTIDPDNVVESTKNWKEQFREHMGRVIEQSLGLAFEDDVIRADKIREVSLPLWLIPTAEVPLTNLVREAITEEDALPLRVTAHTPCFRAEAGAAGKDTRGMIRQHQFPKVELVSVTTPETSGEEHERMTLCAEEVLKRLELPYRTIVLSTGDIGFAAAKTYDIEVWLPGQRAYREISSCSNCGEFQARRMNARYRPAEGK